jgi:hypothetical protein
MQEPHANTGGQQQHPSATAHFRGATTDVHGRTERPGSPLHGHGQRECAEGGVNMVNA